MPIRSNLAWLALLAGTSLPAIALAAPQTSYNLGLQGDIGDNSINSNFQFDNDFNISGMNMNLSGPGLNAQAGDISANWDQLGLAGRSFQGISSGFGVGKVDLSLMAGTVVIDPDIIDPRSSLSDYEAREPVTSTIFGARATIPLKKTLDFSLSQFFTPSAPEGQGSTISTVALNYHPSLRRRLGVELARSQNGIGWQVAASGEGKKLNWQASYRQVSNGFSSAGNPTLRTRRNGGYLKLRYRVSKPLSFIGNLQLYNDGRGGHSNSKALTVRYAPRDKPSVSLFWRSVDNLRLGREPFEDEDNDDYNEVRRDRATILDTRGVLLSHKLGVNRVSFQAEQLRLAYPLGDQPDATSNRFRLGLTRPLGPNTGLSLTHIMSFIQETGDNGRQTPARNTYSAVDVRHKVGKSGLTVNLGLLYQTRRSMAESGQEISLRTGFDYVLGSGSAISIRYGKVLGGSAALGNSDRLHIGYTHCFKNKNRNRGRALTARERREVGKVQGRVFEDINANGRWDEGEPGISDVGVGVQGVPAVQTDGKGRFSFGQLRSGDSQLRLVTKSLPIEFSALHGMVVPVQVVAGKSAEVDLPLVRTGQVTGWVFTDTNRNGLRDEGEPGLPDAVIRVQDSEIISFSAASGEFTLYGLPPKTWKLFVDPASLAEGYQPTGSAPLEVRVQPNATAAGALLGVAPEEREIITGFEKVVLAN